MFTAMPRASLLAVTLVWFLFAGDAGRGGGNFVDAMPVCAPPAMVSSGATLTVTDCLLGDAVTFAPGSQIGTTVVIRNVTFAPGIGIDATGTILHESTIELDNVTANVNFGRFDLNSAQLTGTTSVSIRNSHLVADPGGATTSASVLRCPGTRMKDGTRIEVINSTLVAKGAHSAFVVFYSGGGAELSNAARIVIQGSHLTALSSNQARGLSFGNALLRNGQVTVERSAISTVGDEASAVFLFGDSQLSAGMTVTLQDSNVSAVTNGTTGARREGAQVVHMRASNLTLGARIILRRSNVTVSSASDVVLGIVQLSEGSAVVGPGASIAAEDVAVVSATTSVSADGVISLFRVSNSSFADRAHLTVERLCIAADAVPASGVDVFRIVEITAGSTVTSGASMRLADTDVFVDCDHATTEAFGIGPTKPSGGSSAPDALLDDVTITFTGKLVRNGLTTSADRFVTVAVAYATLQRTVVDVRFGTASMSPVLTSLTSAVAFAGVRGLDGNAVVANSTVAVGWSGSGRLTMGSLAAPGTAAIVAAGAATLMTDTTIAVNGTFTLVAATDAALVHIVAVRGRQNHLIIERVDSSSALLSSATSESASQGVFISDTTAFAAVAITDSVFLATSSAASGGFARGIVLQDMINHAGLNLTVTRTSVTVNAAQIAASGILLQNITGDGNNATTFAVAVRDSTLSLRPMVAFGSEAYVVRVAAIGGASHVALAVANSTLVNDASANTSFAGIVSLTDIVFPVRSAVVIGHSALVCNTSENVAATNYRCRAIQLLGNTIGENSTVLITDSVLEARHAGELLLAVIFLCQTTQFERGSSLIFDRAQMAGASGLAAVSAIVLRETVTFEEGSAFRVRHSAIALTALTNNHAVSLVVDRAVGADIEVSNTTIATSGRTRVSCVNLRDFVTTERLNVTVSGLTCHLASSATPSTLFRIAAVEFHRMNFNVSSLAVADANATLLGTSPAAFAFVESNIIDSTVDLTGANVNASTDSTADDASAIAVLFQNANVTGAASSISIRSFTANLASTQRGARFVVITGASRWGTGARLEMLSSQVALRSATATATFLVDDESHLTGSIIYARFVATTVVTGTTVPAASAALVLLHDGALFEYTSVSIVQCHFLCHQASWSASLLSIGEVLSGVKVTAAHDTTFDFTGGGGLLAASTSLDRGGGIHLGHKGIANRTNITLSGIGLGVTAKQAITAYIHGQVVDQVRIHVRNQYSTMRSVDPDTLNGGAYMWYLRGMVIRDSVFTTTDHHSTVHSLYGDARFAALRTISGWTSSVVTSTRDRMHITAVQQNASVFYATPNMAHDSSFTFEAMTEVRVIAGTVASIFELAMNQGSANHNIIPFAFDGRNSLNTGYAAVTVAIEGDTLYGNGTGAATMLILDSTFPSDATIVVRSVRAQLRAGTATVSAPSSVSIMHPLRRFFRPTQINFTDVEARCLTQGSCGGPFIAARHAVASGTETQLNLDQVWFGGFSREFDNAAGQSGQEGSCNFNCAAIGATDRAWVDSFSQMTAQCRLDLGTITVAGCLPARWTNTVTATRGTASPTASAGTVTLTRLITASASITSRSQPTVSATRSPSRTFVTGTATPATATATRTRSANVLGTATRSATRSPTPAPRLTTPSVTFLASASGAVATHTATQPPSISAVAGSSTRSVQLTVSRTALPLPPPTPEPVALPVPVQRATTAAAVSTVAVASVTSSPASALQMARVLGTLELAERCRESAATGGDAAESMSEATKPGFPRALLPILIVGTAESGGWHRGAVLGNIAVVAIGGLCGVLLCAALVMAGVAGAEGKQRGPLVGGLRLARMPGSLGIAGAMALDGFVASGLVLLLHPDAGESVDIGLAGVAAVGAVATVSLAVFAVRQLRLSSSTTAAGIAGDADRSGTSSVVAYAPATYVASASRVVFSGRPWRFVFINDHQWFPAAFVPDAAAVATRLIMPPAAKPGAGLPARQQREGQQQRATLDAYGLLVAKYRGLQQSATPYGRAAVVIATIASYYFTIELLLTALVSIAQALAAVGTCTEALRLALAANGLALLVAVLLRPYTVPAKNVLLILLNLLTFGASAVTTAAVNAASDAESAGLRRLGTRLASAAAMVGLVGMFLSLMRLVLTRLVYRTTAVIDERRLCFPVRPVAAAAADVHYPLLSGTSNGLPGGGGPFVATTFSADPSPPPAIEMREVPAVMPPLASAGDASSTPTAEEDDDALVGEPETGDASPDFSDFYRTDERNRSRRIERSREGQQHYDELEAMLSGAAPVAADPAVDIDDFLDGAPWAMEASRAAKEEDGDLDDLLGQL